MPSRRRLHDLAGKGRGVDSLENLDREFAWRAVGSRPEGLTASEAAARLVRVGPNEVEHAPRAASLLLLVRQFESPPVLILAAATLVSGVLGDTFSAGLILAMIFASGLLGFWQERGASRAVDALRRVVQVEVEVRRDGRVATVPIRDIVPGDVVLLNAGDLVPADGFVIKSRNLLVEESALTGESFPVEKTTEATTTEPPSRRRDAVYLGSHVISGTAEALVVATGRSTTMGKLSGSLQAPRIRTSFERGMTQFGLLLARLTAVLVGGIFVMNIVLARPIVDSILFSLALAVGLTPEMLPAIVAISLAEGARQMANRQVIVKRLDAIEDIGAMTVLCTDKTGTMTTGAIRFEGGLDIDGLASERPARLAAINAWTQTGFSNPIDAALCTACADPHAKVIDELPYDFSRRRLTVLVETPDGPTLISKGAVESVLAISRMVELPDGRTVDGDDANERVLTQFERLSARGYRVLAVGSRLVPGCDHITAGEETGLTFNGFLAFLDPPREDAPDVILELDRVGVSVRMITGDNRLAAREIGRRMGLRRQRLLTGSTIATLDDDALVEAVRDAGIFAEVDPGQKERLILAFRRAGEVVGYLGDGINDAPALHAADVGISVDTAVDVAKATAAIVLLDKSLGVLLDGVRQGRRTFANTLKYVFTTMSANFGNMLSVAIVAAILPFLPLLATQILLVNFLTDFPATTVATDEVDPEQLDRPQRWDVERLQAFLLRFGALSSVFDLVTFAVLRIGFVADAPLFRSGWFLESVFTEIVVLLVLRTARPFYRSRPGRWVLASTVAVGAVRVAILYSPVAAPLGLEPLSPLVVAALGLITFLYVVATELGKRRFGGTSARAARMSPTAAG